MANAAPVCSYQSTEMWQGHANTLISAANPAVGDYIGTMQVLRVAINCQFDNYGDSGWNIPSWTITTRRTPNLYHANLSGYFADNTLLGSDKPVLTTTELESIGLGFVAVVGMISNSQGLHTESFVPHDGIEKTLFHTHMYGGYHFTINSGLGEDRLSNSNHIKIVVVMYHRLVKINENFNALSATPSTYSIAPFIMGNISFRQVNYQTNMKYGMSNVVSIPSPMHTLTFAQRTCATPHVDDGVVRLPMINQNDLPSVGSVGPEVKFELKVNCPTNLGYIGYYVQPVHGIANGLESQGVININPASTAKGIGLQITTHTAPKWPDYLQYVLNGGNQPIRFGPTNRYGWGGGYRQFGSGPDGDPLNDRATYKTPTPLLVRVYRTGDVVPGTFNAAIWVHMVYR